MSTEEIEILKFSKEIIPSVDFILNEAYKKLNLNKAFIENNFGEALILLDKEATMVFKTYEEKALIKLANLWLNSQKEKIRKKLEKIVAQKGWNEFIKKASKIFLEFAKLVQALEKDLGNMRKARGGKTFEKIILKFLNFLEIKSEIPTAKAKEVLKRIDIVIPSVSVAIRTPDRAIFLTCKRTLRERWKQEVPQARLNQRIYLLTIDEELSLNKADEINEKGLIAFVPDKILERAEFKNKPWIRKLKDLPSLLKKI